jgi:membrane associated rhomboid family serine protease
MAARLCPYCKELNSVGERRCYRCGRRLPGPAADGALRLVQQLLGVEAPVTRLLLFLELAVFALCVIVEHTIPDGIGFFGFLGLKPSFNASTLLRFGALGGALGRTEPWRYLSAVFVHAGIVHIGMNLWIFTSLGYALERELGGARFALLFLLSGALGFVASSYWYAPVEPLTMGASGGVFGQIGAWVGILGARRDPEWKNVFVRNLIYAVLLSLALGNVNTPAHLGGFAAGIAIGFLFGREKPKWRLEWPLRLLAAVGLCSVVASVGLSMRSPVWQVVHLQESRYE